MSNVLEPQNFSVLAGNDVSVFIDIGPDDDSLTLVGASIVWKVYEQVQGLPVADADPIIEKSNGDGGTLTVDDPETQTLKIPLTAADTAGLLRNYYHECTVVDENLGTITVAMGIMTVLGTENR